MRLNVDQARAQEVVLRLDVAFRSYEGLLSERDDLVENQFPPGVKKGSGEHARFLFFTVPNDHGVKSSRLYEKAIDLFQRKPNLFDPQFITSRFRGAEDADLINATGIALGTRYPKSTAKGWYLNSSRLMERFNGDPRGVFQASADAEVLLKLVCSFYGFGPKTGGMLIRALDGLGMARVTGLERVLVPVDIHDSRISFFTGIVSCNDAEIEKNYHIFARPIQRVLTDACAEADVRWPDVDRALWLIGSRGCVRLRCRECPLKMLCSVGRSRSINDPASEQPSAEILHQAHLPW